MVKYNDFINAYYLDKFIYTRHYFDLIGGGTLDITLSAFKFSELMLGLIYEGKKERDPMNRYRWFFCFKFMWISIASIGPEYK